MERRLYRSRRERIIGGVAGGLGEYLGIDPVIIRVLLIVLALATGWGVLLYIVMLIVVPEAPALAPGEVTPEPAYRHIDTRSRGLLLGGALVALGLVLLAKQLGLWWWIDMGRFWPLLLVAAGVALLIDRARS